MNVLIQYNTNTNYQAATTPTPFTSLSWQAEQSKMRKFEQKIYIKAKPFEF